MFRAHSIRYSEEAVCRKISLFFAAPPNLLYRPARLPKSRQ